MKYLFTCLLFVLAAFTSCKKSKRPGWLVFDVQVLVDGTNEPVPATIKLCYKESQGWGASEEEITLGGTNSLGYMHVERKVKRNQGGFEIKVYQNQHYTLMGTVGQATYSASVHSGELITAKINVVHPARLIFNSINCTGASDSVWFDAYYTDQTTNLHLSDTLTGCVDTILVTTQPYTVLWPGQNITVAVHTVKSGVHSEFSVNRQLSSTSITDVQIDY